MKTTVYSERALKGEIPNGTVTVVVERFHPSLNGTGYCDVTVEESDVPGIASGQSVRVGMSTPVEANLQIGDLETGYGDMAPVPVGSIVTFTECERINDGEIDVCGYDAASIVRPEPGPAP